MLNGVHITLYYLTKVMCPSIPSWNNWLKMGQLSLRSLEIKVIIKKSRGGRFLWKRNWYLGWIWAGWNYWKKNFWADDEQLLKSVFSSFHGQKKVKKKKHCSGHTKKLHKMKLKNSVSFSLQNKKDTFSPLCTVALVHS